LVRSYSNPDLDKLLDSGAQLFKPEDRRPVYREAIKTIIDEAWYIYTVHVAQVRVMRKEVQNFKTSPDDMEIWLKYVDLRQ
jgi:ABC-type transport system substrate-binding protein